MTERELPKADQCDGLEANQWVFVDSTWIPRSTNGIGIFKRYDQTGLYPMVAFHVDVTPWAFYAKDVRPATLDEVIAAGHDPGKGRIVSVSDEAASRALEGEG